MAVDKEVLIEASSLEEAMEKANQLLKVPRDKIDYTVISKNSSGLFKGRKKNYVIKAKPKGLADLEQLINDALAEKESGDIMESSVNARAPKRTKQVLKNPGNDGTIEIKNGQAIVKDPADFGKLPVITAGENTEVFINGEKISETTIVSSEDRIKINVLNSVPTATVEVEIAEDRMSAFLTIEREMGRRFVIDDIEPVKEIVVKAHCVHEEQPAEVNFKEIMKSVNEKGISFGIDTEAIIEAINSTEKYIKKEIARGVLPSGVMDAEIKYSFINDQRQENAKNPYGDGEIKSVNKGEVIAIKKPPVKGVPGLEVTGTKIPPREPRDIEILARDGVEIIKNGTLAVAAISGRPVLEGNSRKFLSVLPVHVVDGDIDVHMGNIKFKGDVIINGSVLDGFKVEAGGNIEVFGNCLRAGLFAYRDIIIHKKAITAKIQAGGAVVIYQQIEPVIAELAKRITTMAEAMNFLKKQESFSMADLKEGEGQLIQLLLDFKYKDVPKKIEKLAEIISEVKYELIPEITMTVQLMIEKLCNLGPLRIKDQSEISDLISEVQKLAEIVHSLADNKAQVIVDYVQNSVIEASGNIEIRGQGSVTSVLIAGGEISVPKGVVRGGSVAAREKIEIRELGSSRDAIVDVRLREHCVLKADIVHPVVVFEHGTKKYSIDDECRYLTASVSEQGNIQVDKLNA